MVFDAKDLSLMSHVTGSDLALVGLHGKFFPLENNDVITTEDPDNSAAVSAVCWPVLMLIVGKLVLGL